MPLLLFDSVSSTMDMARNELLAGRVRFETSGRAVPNGIRAEEQTAGRGQRGRTWFAQRGECLCATYYFHYGLTSPEAAGQLAFPAGVAVAETLEDTRLKIDKETRRKGEGERGEGKRKKEKGESVGALLAAPNPAAGLAAPAPQSKIENRKSKIPINAVGLKWPNDVLLNGRKVGGILIELVHCNAATPDLIRPQVSSTGVLYAGLPPNSLPEWVALIGVGINVLVREFPAELEATATSLWREGLQNVDVGELAEAVGDALERCAEMRNTQGFEAILHSWRAFDVTPGRRYATVWEGKSVQGTAEGIEADGALRLRLTNGRLARVQSATSLQELPR